MIEVFVRLTPESPSCRRTRRSRAGRVRRTACEGVGRGEVEVLRGADELPLGELEREAVERLAARVDPGLAGHRRDELIAVCVVASTPRDSTRAPPGEREGRELRLGRGAERRLLAVAAAADDLLNVEAGREGAAQRLPRTTSYVVVVVMSPRLSATSNSKPLAVSRAALTEAQGQRREGAAAGVGAADLEGPGVAEDVLRLRRARLDGGGRLDGGASAGRRPGRRRRSAAAAAGATGRDGSGTSKVGGGSVMTLGGGGRAKRGLAAGRSAHDGRAGEGVLCAPEHDVARHLLEADAQRRSGPPQPAASDGARAAAGRGSRGAPSAGVGARGRRRAQLLGALAAGEGEHRANSRSLSS
jgi:hypothetical protein